MSYVCIQKNRHCSYANVNGYCSVSVCIINPLQTYLGSTGGACINRMETVPNCTMSKPDTIVFPQTIGNITFYSSKELIKWVEYQQEINNRRIGG